MDGSGCWKISFRKCPRQYVSAFKTKLQRKKATVLPFLPHLAHRRHGSVGTRFSLHQLGSCHIARLPGAARCCSRQALRDTTRVCVNATWHPAKQLLR